MMCDSADGLAGRQRSGPTEQGRESSSVCLARVCGVCHDNSLTTIMCCRDSAGQKAVQSRSPIRLQQKAETAILARSSFSLLVAHD